ncbi:hypothetical protein ACWD25_01515 [Streptomyces sp. NPDC002920]
MRRTTIHPYAILPYDGLAVRRSSRTTIQPYDEGRTTSAIRRGPYDGENAAVRPDRRTGA